MLNLILSTCWTRKEISFNHTCSAFLNAKAWITWNLSYNILHLFWLISSFNHAAVNWLLTLMCPTQCFHCFLLISDQCSLHLIDICNFDTRQLTAIRIGISHEREFESKMKFMLPMCLVMLFWWIWHIYWVEVDMGNQFSIKR